MFMDIDITLLVHHGVEVRRDLGEAGHVFLYSPELGIALLSKISMHRCL